MEWETLTSDEFAAVVASTGGVCVVPISVVERHASHLPLGTDTYIGRDICRRATALEPALVFPDYIFTQILEARHLPGTVALDADLILRLIDNVCREIARNGCKKIILFSAHGGNGSFAPYFAQAQLQSPREYVVYIATPRLTEAEEAELQERFQTPIGDHAGETETSAILAIRPDLVHMDRVTPGEGDPQGRLNALRDVGVYTGIWWYADHPTHYQGDAQPATREKGELYLSAMAAGLARIIRSVREDDVVRRLQDEFFGTSNG